MPDTLQELSLAYSVIWGILFFLILKLGRDVGKLEKKLFALDAKENNDQ